VGKTQAMHPTAPGWHAYGLIAGGENVMSNAVYASFEIAAERGGDIAPAIYEAYFARCPESRELMRFVDEYMRGRMLDSVYELLMADETPDQLRYLRFEVTNHASYSVLPHMYANLLSAVRDTVRAACGNDWTPGMAAAWDARLGVLKDEISSTLDAA
jgi:hypothetical protein